MGYEFDREKLEAALSESVIVLQLRDILTKTGIPSDETVTLRIQQDDDIIVSVEVPKKSPEIIIPQLATNFAEEIDDFLKRAGALTGLLSALPKSALYPDKSTIISLFFEIGKLRSGEALLNTGEAPRQTRQGEAPRQTRQLFIHVCCDENDVCDIC
jgi:hypothetical protein